MIFNLTCFTAYFEMATVFIELRTIPWCKHNAGKFFYVVPQNVALNFGGAVCSIDHRQFFKIGGFLSHKNFN